MHGHEREHLGRLENALYRHQVVIRVLKADIARAVKLIAWIPLALRNPVSLAAVE
jgi:hypothetical protein